MSNKLLRSKVCESITEFSSEFKKWGVMRSIFETINWDSLSIPKLEKDFIKIGYSHIIPRNFFTKFTGTTYYDNKGIGSNYGKGLAFGETKYILNILEKKIDKKDYHRRTKSRVSDLMSALFNSYPDVRFAILANPGIISYLMNEKEFSRKYSDTRFGTFNDRPLFWNPEISKSVVYLVDRDLGTLYVKKDVTMEVQEIKSSEYETILKNVDDLSRLDLPNMVRVKSYELIFFKERDSLQNGVIKIDMVDSE